MVGNRIIPVHFDLPQALKEDFHLDYHWRKETQSIEYFGNVRHEAPLGHLVVFRRWRFEIDL